MVKVDLTGAAGFLGNGPDYEAAEKAYETLLNKAQENVKEKRSLLEYMSEFKVAE